MANLSRRGLLRGLALAPLGVMATTRGSRTAMAASEWSDTELSYQSSDGTISTFEIGSSDLSFQFSWSNFPESTTTTVDLTVNARLPNSEGATGTYETVLSGGFQVNGSSGDNKPVTGGDITLSNGSFPVDVFSATSIDASQFAVPDGSTEKTTVVDFQIEFSYEDESIVRESTCYVTISEPATKLIDDFERSDLSAYTVNAAGSSVFEGGSISLTTSPVQNGGQAVAIQLDGQNGRRGIQSLDVVEDAVPTPGDTFEFYIQYGNSNPRRCGFSWLLQELDSSKQYRLRLNRSEQNLVLMDTNGVIASKSWTPTSNVWWRVEVEHATDHMITVDVYEPDGTLHTTLSGQGTMDYTSGGISWHGNTNSSSSGGTVYFDTGRIL